MRRNSNFNTKPIDVTDLDPIQTINARKIYLHDNRDKLKPKSSKSASSHYESSVLH